MNIVAVEFEGAPDRKYYYKTNLNLLNDGIYFIVADNKTTYNNRVKVLNIFSNDHDGRSKNLRVITSAKLLQSPAKPKKRYKKIIANIEKKTVCVLWNDGTRTIMKPQPGDDFDLEKGVAMCFMKKVYQNRGCFNDAFRDIEIV